MERKIKTPDIRQRLENDPIFRQTSERMIAEILDSNIENADGGAKQHTHRCSKELLEPHINNLRISIIDGFEAGNLRYFLVFHNALRRLIEISIESVHSECVSDRIKDFGIRRERAEAMNVESEEEELEDPEDIGDPDRDAHDPDLPPPSEMFKEVK